MVSNSSTPRESVKIEEKIIETFSNSRKIGVAGKYKVDVIWFDWGDHARVSVKFYLIAKGRKSKLIQIIQHEKFGGMPLHPEISDFNNDGLADLTFISDTAARGANEIRALYIFDEKTGKLVFIKNSEDFPNLEYNRRLDCLDSQRFTATTSTSFLKIERDRLREFARVDLSGGFRTALKIDRQGKEKVLSRKRISDQDVFLRYMSFDPPSTD